MKLQRLKRQLLSYYLVTFKLEYSRMFDFIPDIIWKASFGALTLCSLTLSSTPQEALTNEDEPGSVFA